MRDMCCLVFSCYRMFLYFFFFFQAEDGIRDIGVTGVQTCALPICLFTTGNENPGGASKPGDRRSGVDFSYRLPRFRNWLTRSEERRVGKECRSWWWPYH